MRTKPPCSSLSCVNKQTAGLPSSREIPDALRLCSTLQSGHSRLHPQRCNRTRDRGDKPPQVEHAGPPTGRPDSKAPHSRRLLFFPLSRSQAPAPAPLREFRPMELLLVSLASVLAGFVDAVVGGGGLI